MNSFDQIQCEDLLDPSIDKQVYPHLGPMSDDEILNKIEMFLDI